MLRPGPKPSRRALACGLAAVAWLGLFPLPKPARAETPADGPQNLLITYRSKPADRPAFRTYLEHVELARLAAWKAKGLLKDYQILFNVYDDVDTWDAMLVVRFPDYASVGRWQDQVERTQPGGLDAQGLALGTPAQTYSADMPWTDGDWDGAGSVFYVIPYEYNSEAEYSAYVDGYVIPQVRGWMKDGVLAGYRIYMNRDPVGRRWDSLFVYRYRDLAAFGRREAVVAKVRAGLVDDPTWKALNDKKRTIRTESDNVIAASLQPR